MSVEDVQKVNRLAQELLDQNMASSREDAVKQAQQILNKKIADKQEIDKEGNAVVKDDLDYYKNIITRTKEYTLQQLNVFKKEIETLTTEVNKLKAEIATMNFSKEKSAQESGLADKKVKKAKQQKLKDKKKETHPIQGNFGSGDVAIDKIFYFGKK